MLLRLIFCFSSCCLGGGGGRNVGGGKFEGMVSVRNVVRNILAHVLEDESESIFKDCRLVECSRSPYSTATPGFFVH